MSSTSPQQEAAAQQSETQANLASSLSGIALPKLQSMLGQGGTLTNLLGSTANGQVASSWDQEALDRATSQLNTSYGQAGFGNKEAINYGALRSGEGRMSSAVPGSILASTATSLERDRQSALANLKFQSGSASMNDYNSFLNLMGQGTNTALGLAQGFSGAGNAAIGGLSNTSQFGSTLGGAATGAGIGSMIYPGVGTVVGGVIGGAAGYLGSG